MKLDADVLEALGAARIDGTRLVLTAQLDRKLYVRVDAALKALGGRWARKVHAHEFDTDPREVIGRALDQGAVETARDQGWFPTPPELARSLVERANVRPGMVAIEPSAGEGALVSALQAAGAQVTAVEVHAGRAATARTRCPGATVHARDFLDTHPMLLPLADVVVMNPPFAVEGLPQADITHVTFALEVLRPGGTLVAVMGAGVTFRRNDKTRDFVTRVAGMGGRFEPLPAGAFRASGTDVHAVVLTIPEVR